MQKLMMSKAIMDKSDNIKRGNQLQETSLQSLNVQEFDTPNAKFNIPSEYVDSIQGSPKIQSPKMPTTDAIMSSKLPDEIKKLMIEHPIVPPQIQAGPTLSNELVEKASRLMKENSNNYIPPSAQKLQTKNSTPVSPNLDYNTMKSIVKEVVEEVLKENGVIAESTEKTNEVFSFRVGKHIFEGKVTKIKKTA